MPRRPSGEEVATKRIVVLVTPRQDAEYFALARHLGKPLAEVIRGLLERERTRLERGGVRVPKK